jgi:Helix-turn-helix domain
MSQINLLGSILGDSPDSFEKPSTLAALVGVKPETISDWAKRYPEQLPALRLPGGSIRIRRSDLVTFIAKTQAKEGFHQ